MQKQSRFRNYPVYFFVLGILLSRLFVYSRIGIRVEPDSNGYRVPGEGWLLPSLASIVGHELRPFPINFVYGILSNDITRILFQTSLTCFAWTFLATEIRKQMLYQSQQKYLWLFFSLLVFSPSLIYRDLVILPESITLSVTLIAISIGLKLRTLERKPKKLLTLFTLLLTFLVIQRPTLSLLSITLLILFLFGRSIQGIKEFFLQYRKISIILFFVSILGLASNLQNNHVGWPNSFASSYPVYKDAFVPGLQMWSDHPFYRDWRAAYSKNGLPSCASKFSSFPGPYEYSVESFGECEEANKWLKDNFWESQVKTLVQNPSLVMGSAIYFGILSFVPQPDIFVLEQIGFGKFFAFPTFGMFGLERLEGLNFLIAWNTFFFAFLLLFGLVVFKKQDGFSIANFTMVHTCLLIALSLNLLFMGLIMPSDSYRHAMPVNYLVLFVLYLGITPLKTFSNFQK